MAPKSTSRAGFTLIEIMMVIAILGVLATVAIPAFLRTQHRARQSEAPIILALFKTGMMSFFGTHDCYMDVAPNPPTVPTSGNPLPFSNAVSGLDPCDVGALEVADLDIDIGAPVYHQYSCAAVFSGGRPGYACDAEGDIDGDGQRSLWVTCSDSDDDDVCDGPSPKGATAPVINAPVRVSSERF